MSRITGGRNLCGSWDWLKIQSRELRMSNGIHGKHNTRCWKSGCNSHTLMLPWSMSTMFSTKWSSLVAARRFRRSSQGSCKHTTFLAVFPRSLWIAWWLQYQRAVAVTQAFGKALIILHHFGHGVLQLTRFNHSTANQQVPKSKQAAYVCEHAEQLLACFSSSVLF